MVGTRAVPRNLRRTSAQAAAAVARLSRPAWGIAIKIIENNRSRNKDIKIKKLLLQSKNIEVKHRGRRKMNVRRRAFFPAYRREREY